MRTHVLRAHVTRHGGSLVSADSNDVADFLCCDKATTPDKMEELWGKHRGDLTALDNMFISKCVVEQRRLALEDFVLRGTVLKDASSKVCCCPRARAFHLLRPMDDAPSGVSS
jgi:hypothetical protein